MVSLLFDIESSVLLRNCISYALDIPLLCLHDNFHVSFDDSWSSCSTLLGGACQYGDLCSKVHILFCVRKLLLRIS